MSYIIYIYIYHIYIYAQFSKHTWTAHVEQRISCIDNSYLSGFKMSILASFCARDAHQQQELPRQHGWNARAHRCGPLELTGVDLNVQGEDADVLFLFLVCSSLVVHVYMIIIYYIYILILTYIYIYNNFDIHISIYILYYMYMIYCTVSDFACSIKKGHNLPKVSTANGESDVCPS